MDGANGLVAVVMLILLIASLSGAVGWWLGRHGAKRQFASGHFASVEADWSRKLAQASQDTHTLVAQEASKVAKLTADLDTQQKALSAAESALGELQRQATEEAAAQQTAMNQLREALSLTAQRDKDLAGLRARIGELEAFPGKLADVERRLEEGAVAQSLINGKEEEIASLGAQSRQQWAAAIHAKDQEIGGLWARIRELEPLAGHLKDWELHHHTTIHAKDEEITSLIERLKEFERLSARLAECEAKLAVWAGARGAPERSGALPL